MPRTLAGLPTPTANGYTQSNRRALKAGLGSVQQRSIMGLGEDPGTQQVAMSTTQIAGGAASSIIGAVGTTATGMATWAAVAIPVVGAAVAAVTIWLSSMFRKNAQKEAATNIVDQIEVQLKSNLEGYLNGPRTQQSQLQALANFDAGWQAVVENCSNPELGSAGKRCISERQQGGTAPWCSLPGGKGCDWFTRYRDPIANDTPVQSLNNKVIEGEGMAVDIVNQVLGGTVDIAGHSIPTGLLVGGALLLVAVTAGGSGGKKA